MQLCRPVDEIFSVRDATTSLDEGPEDHLISIAANIPKLQHLSNLVFIQLRDASDGDFDNLLHSARVMDQEISDWARTIPTTWSYSAAMNVEDPASKTKTSFTPLQVHKYPSFYIARVWNFYRVSRLIVQSVLIRALSRLSVSVSVSTDRGDGDEMDERTRIERGSLELVNDICASVPFLLGDDLSKMKLPTPSVRRESERSRRPPPSDKESGPTRTGGRFSLIWPLYVACSSTSVPESQRDWMRTQLRLLAEHGETQAHSVCFTKSQILLGGADDVRFDFV